MYLYLFSVSLLFDLLTQKDRRIVTPGESQERAMRNERLLGKSVGLASMYTWPTFESRGGYWRFHKILILKIPIQILPASPSEDWWQLKYRLKSSLVLTIVNNLYMHSKVNNCTLYCKIEGRPLWAIVTRSWVGGNAKPCWSPDG